MSQVRFYSKIYKRPKWQDITPDTPEGRDAYRIAAKYENGFTRAYLKLIRNLLPDKMPKWFRDLYNDRKTNELIGSFPFFSFDSDVWNTFLESIKRAYYKVVDESGKETANIVNDKFDREFQFTMYDGKVGVVEEIIKQIPINPYSIDWINEHSLELVVAEFTPMQESIVRSILSSSFSLGIRAESTYKAIKETIGLTDREYKAVENRRLLHEQAGLSKSEVDRLVSKYSDQLLRKRAQRIARTETIAAQAKGRQHAWQMARESGDLGDNVVRVWITPPLSPNPTRPCKICVGLDNKQAPINGSYESDHIGTVDGPPAHPHCRCTESLEVI